MTGAARWGTSPLGCATTTACWRSHFLRDWRDLQRRAVRSRCAIDHPARRQGCSHAAVAPCSGSVAAMANGAAAVREVASLRPYGVEDPLCFAGELASIPPSTKSWGVGWHLAPSGGAVPSHGCLVSRQPTSPDNSAYNTGIGNLSEPGRESAAAVIPDQKPGPSNKPVSSSDQEQDGEHLAQATFSRAAHRTSGKGPLDHHLPRGGESRAALALAGDSIAVAVAPAVRAVDGVGRVEVRHRLGVPPYVVRGAFPANAVLIDSVHVRAIAE